MKHLWKSLFVLTMCITLSSCVSKKKFTGLETDFNQLKTNYQGCLSDLRECNTRTANLEERLADAQKSNKELQDLLNKSMTQSTQGSVNISKLVDEINASNRFIQHLVEAKNRSDSLNMVLTNNLTRSLTREEKQDMDIQVMKGVVYISLDDKMLYKSGSYEISEKAGETLSKIAKIIQDHKDYDVLVEGNTDTDPISRPNIRNNWDLSALRGSSVVQALQTTYGIDPKRLTVGGRGEYNPITNNNTPEGKAKNRRTQIIITPNLDQFMDLIDQAPKSSLEDKQ